MLTVLAELTNSEGEKITIERVENGPFRGKKVLVIHDDDGRVKAPHLLDKQTLEWLVRNCSHHLATES